MDKRPPQIRPLAQPLPQPSARPLGAWRDAIRKHPNLRGITAVCFAAAVSTLALAGPSVNFGVAPVISVTGTIWNDADANVTINGSPLEAGTNAGGLIVYAVNSSGVVVDKATVNTNGTYTFSKVPANTGLTLRLSTDSSIAPCLAMLTPVLRTPPIPLPLSAQEEEDAYEAAYLLGLEKEKKRAARLGPMPVTHGRFRR